MKKAKVLLAVLFIAMVWASVAFTLVEERELRGANIEERPDWPAGLKELIHLEGRVYGRIFQMDAPSCKGVSHYYVGDYESFNWFLKQYAKVKPAPLTLILHPRVGAVSRVAGKEGRILFDWQIQITTARSLKKETENEKQKYKVTVDLWIGGNVDMGKIEVPLNIELKSGGEIEKFVAAHQARRKEAEEADK